MKYLYLFAFILCLGSCQKEKCKSCFVVIYSDELKKCGRENNGTEEISTTSAGEVCDSDLEAVRASVESTNTVRSSCGANYTLTTKLECR